jgi:hypothetical protein
VAHNSTGRLLHAMGNVKFSLGRLDESEHYHRKALAHYQSTIGNDHHRTADVCHRVAQHCSRRGELKQARYPIQMPRFVSGR